MEKKYHLFLMVQDAGLTMTVWVTTYSTVNVGCVKFCKGSESDIPFCFNRFVLKDLKNM